MPTYNQERYVRTAVRSVLSQTIPDWQLLVVDDGSTDGTLEVVESVADDRISLLRFEHRGLDGLGDRYNAGLQRATGDLIAILDGDDAWPHCKLERQLPLHKSGATLSWGTAEVITDSGLRTGRRVVEKCRYPRPGTGVAAPHCSLLSEMLLHNLVAPSTAVIRTRSLTDIGGFRQPPGCPFVDYLTWLALLRAGQGQPSSEVMAFWRVHPSQTSKQLALSVREHATRIALEFLDSLEQGEREATGLDAEAITKHRAYHLADTYLDVALEALCQGHYDSTRRCLAAVFSMGHRSTKLRTAASLLLSLLRMGLRRVECDKPARLGKERTWASGCADEGESEI
jgi:glycosyltransferase involved in cell wall biosynthesis